VGAARQLIEGELCQFVRPMFASRSIAKPAVSLNVDGPLVDSCPKFDEPPSAVIPPRSSFTMVDESVDRSVRLCSGRVDLKSVRFGAPGNRGSSLFR
jgi:hypothetical protein